MNEFELFTLTFITGLLLGFIFFGGLWWTVRQGLKSNYASWWFLVSFILRTGAVLAGFYWISNHNLIRLGFCMTGFILGRFTITRLSKQVEGGKS